MIVRFLKTPKGEKEYCTKCHKEVKLIKINKKQWVKGSRAYGDSHITGCCNDRIYFAVK